MSALYDEQTIVWHTDPNNEAVMYAELDAPHSAMVALAYMPKSKPKWMWRASDGKLIERDYGINEFNCKAAAIQWLNAVTVDSNDSELDAWFPRNADTGEPMDDEITGGLPQLGNAIATLGEKLEEDLSIVGVQVAETVGQVDPRMDEYELVGSDGFIVPSDPHEELGFVPQTKLKDGKLPLKRDAKSMMADLHPEEAEIVKSKKPRTTKQKKAELPKVKGAKR